MLHHLMHLGPYLKLKLLLMIYTLPPPILPPLPKPIALTTFMRVLARCLAAALL